MSVPGTIIWSRKTEADLHRVYSVLAPKNLKAAKRCVSTIADTLNLLPDNPHMGRPSQLGGYEREIIIGYGGSGYVCTYRVFDSDIIILRIWHQREKR